MSGPFDRDSMSSERGGPESFDHEVERALEHIDPPRARGEFRALLRERFVHAGAETDGAAPARPRLAPGVLHAPRPATASRWRGWTAAAALMAAGLVLAFFLMKDGAEQDSPELVGGGNAAPGVQAPEALPASGISPWTVLAAPASIVVDGRTLDTSDTAALEVALAGAKRVATGADSGDLRLRMADLMLIELGPASEIVLAGCNRIPREGAGRAIEALAGAVRIATGPDFDGLAVGTPDLELSITGTALAVDVYDEGTCVCCSEGHVAIQDRESPCSHALQAHEMAFVFRQPRPCAAGPEMPDHAAPLALLLAAAEGIWGPR